MNPLDYSAQDYVGTQLFTAQSPPKTSPPNTRALELKADAVIVGSGPGGLTTACVLAEAGLKVIVLEAGQFWPKGSFKRKQSWANENLYQDKAMRVSTGNAFIPVTSGRGVGGGTLVNSCICFRAPDHVLDEWVNDFGLTHWRKDHRDALYSEVEQVIGVADTPAAIAGNNALLAKRGFDKLQLDAGFMPRNAPGCVGCGTCQTGCPTGGKASADLNWLPRILRADGDLYADTTVDEIILADGRAVGVKGVMRHPKTNQVVTTIKVQANHIILAAGTINTPMLLQRQNLANSSGQVGRNLRMHPGCAVMARFDEDVRIWSGATQGYYAHHPDDPEILLETFSASPEVFMTQAMRIGIDDPSQFLRELRHVAGCGVVVRDHSSGRVQRGKDGRAKITYQVSEFDRRQYSKGLLLIVDMFFAAGAKRVMPMLGNTRYFSSANHAKDHIRRATNPAEMSLYASHPMGTCRMAEDPATSVVRPHDGRTHDVEGLYISDASLFPTALGANPQMTIMAQSLALARGILQTASFYSKN